MKKAALHTFDTCVSMLSEESNQRPKFLTVLDGFTNELPTFMLVTSSFDVCWGVPIIINSVLLSLSLSLFWSIHERTYLMHVSKTDIFSWISVFGLKEMYHCVSSA